MRKPRLIPSWKLLCLAGTLAATAPAIRAQEKAQEPVATQAEAKAPPTSQVTGIALGRAHLVTEKEAIEKLSAQLVNLAEQAGLPLGAPEVLAWGGDDDKGYKPEQAKDLIAQVNTDLDKGGWKLEAAGPPQQGPESRVSLFTGASDAQQKMLMGYWVESDSMLLVVWAPMLPPTVEDKPVEDKPVEDKPAAPAPADAPK